MRANTDALYLSWGAGPMPLLDDEAHREQLEYLFIWSVYDHPKA